VLVRTKAPPSALMRRLSAPTLAYRSSAAGQLDEPTPQRPRKPLQQVKRRFSRIFATRALNCILPRLHVGLPSLCTLLTASETASLGFHKRGLPARHSRARTHLRSRCSPGGPFSVARFGTVCAGVVAYNDAKCSEPVVCTQRASLAYMCNMLTPGGFS
jgi:hypothetical protein